ncbi:hypothetical protein DKX38_018168 [Salix brachista]|uniref:Uncharacterized protein n=1 Tax=Salix brachista TaxID=2182728 RepID=A0A5N5KMV0_9ROSI|nr:hypothetical protein DKX38_018168 [Salix brachista]
MRKFKHLQYLNLGENSFSGPIPYDFEQLTELVLLVLSGNENDYLSLEPTSFDKLVQNLTQLRDLRLSMVDMSMVAPDSLMNLSSSLSSLILYSCRLQGKLPSSMRKFKHLQYLDLSSGSERQQYPKVKSNSDRSSHTAHSFRTRSNNLSGPLPTEYLYSLEALMAYDQNSRNYSDYAYSIRMIWKEFETESEKIPSASIIETWKRFETEFEKIPSASIRVTWKGKVSNKHSRYLTRYQVEVT